MIQFGRYQLLRRIAVGGMAEVYLARTASLGGFERIVVIKRIRPEHGDDIQFCSAFIDEARIASALVHPNIVETFDFGEVDRSYYIAAEYVSGCDLGSLLALEGVQRQGLDPGLSLFIMHEVCKGLHHAHHGIVAGGRRRSVVHRDVSPPNVLVSMHGSVKLTDFGIARVGGADSAGDTSISGKLPYMSPEQAAGQPLDARSDLFSAGLVLWELLVGRRAYGHDAEAPSLKEVRRGRVPPPSQHNPALPAALARDLDTLLRRALASKPRRRYAAAWELGHDIQALLHREYPQVDARALRRFLEANREELQEITEALRTGAGGDPAGPEDSSIAAVELARRQPAEVSAEAGWSPEILALARELLAQPDVWRIAAMARASEQAGDGDSALVFWRAAAVKFAQAGLLAQALLCARGMLRHRPLAELRDEIRRLPSLVGAGDAEVAAYLCCSGGAGARAEALLQSLLAAGSVPRSEAPAGTALLSYMGGDAFAELAAAVESRRFDEGDNVVEERQAGDTMYLVGEGRVVIYTAGASKRRLYLSSLTAGDFFGENSFFTGAPRSATVQAVRPTEVFEIDRALYDRVMVGAPDAAAILLRFYMQRVVDTLMAKSDILGSLPPEDRRELLDHFALKSFDAGELLIREGSVTDSIFLIKQGKAEVFSAGDRDAGEGLLATVGPASIVGEVAALRQIPRTASIRAITPVEALELSGAVFAAAIQRRPEVAAKVNRLIAERARQNLNRLSLFRRFEPGAKS